MSTKHTPGPWHLNRTMMQGKTLGWHIAADEHGSSLPVCVSDKFSEYRDPVEDVANARLIATSPDMIHALKVAENVLDLAQSLTEKSYHHPEILAAYYIVRAARSKATGEPT